MKRFVILILSALLFAGCNNMLTNHDAFNVEEASISMDISRLIARVAGEGDVITSTLEFVGEEPKHAPFEKTQTINGSTVNYIIKGIPVGSSVQVKLSVFKNDILVFEGLSDKITIKGKNNLTIGLDKISNWFLYDVDDYCFVIDANFTSFNDAAINVQDPYNKNKLGIDFIDSWDDPNRTTEFRGSCMDDKDNVYVISYEFGTLNLYRLRPPFKTPFLLTNYSTTDTRDITLKFDNATDSLYVFNASGYYIIPNASTTVDTAESINAYGTTGENGPKPYDFPDNFIYDVDDKFDVYNNELYWISTPDSGSGYACYKSGKDEPLILYSASYNSTIKDFEYSGAIATEMKSAFDKSIFKAEPKDFTVTKEGVFALIRDHGKPNFYNKDYPEQQKTHESSRGGVIKMNHNLTSAKIYGWTESQRVITVTNTGENGNGEPYTDVYLSEMYLPKNLKNGFYGPTKILAVKPRKLIFTDRGGWVYLDENNDVKQKLEMSQNIIVFDLESCTYTSMPMDITLPVLASNPNWSEFSNSTSTSVTETWQ